MRVADASSLHLPSSNAETRPAHNDVEIHTKDTDTRVISCTKINVFLNTETEMPVLREVAFAELVLLDLQATFEDLLGFGTADGDVYCDLFVTTDTECSDGVPGFCGDGGLAGELLEDLGCSC